MRIILKPAFLSTSDWPNAPDGTKITFTGSISELVGNKRGQSPRFGDSARFSVWNGATPEESIHGIRVLVSYRKANG